MANSTKGKTISVCGRPVDVFFNDFIGVSSNGEYGRDVAWALEPADYTHKRPN
jgi:hypothetical protein